MGFRFSPTGQELINHYLKNKVLDKPWLVDEAINEINICAHDPKFLPGNFILSFSTSKINHESFLVLTFFWLQRYRSWTQRILYGTSSVEGSTTYLRRRRERRGQHLLGSGKLLVLIGRSGTRVLRSGSRRRLSTMKVNQLMVLGLLGSCTSITSLPCLLVRYNYLNDSV